MTPDDLTFANAIGRAVDACIAGQQSIETTIAALDDLLKRQVTLSEQMTAAHLDALREVKVHARNSGRLDEYRRARGAGAI